MPERNILLQQLPQGNEQETRVSKFLWGLFSWLCFFAGQYINYKGSLRVQTLTTINLFRNVQVGHYYTPQMIFTVYTSTLTILISDSSQARSRTIHSSIKLCLWPSE